MSEQGQLLHETSIQFGCDPEMFFTSKDGAIIGAERVLPASGTLGTRNPLDARFSFNEKALVLDGVQVELNPKPSQCRETLGNELALTFRTLKAHLAKLENVSVSFNSIVTVDKKELQALSERARQFGCLPSFNAYFKDAEIKCNPATYLKRSAGGHIHIGLYGSAWSRMLDPKWMPVRERLVPILDAVVGNTCVLIDRHPEAAERRKNYGRAGEYRLPAHGLEYRTLSNFWLQSYQLFSFVMGLTRLAVRVMSTTVEDAPNITGYNRIPAWDAESDLMKRFDLRAVAEAINTNDYKLAYANFKHLKDFIREHVPDKRGYSLSPETLDAFDHFHGMINEHGLSYWFPEEPLEHWCTLGNLDANGQGWESFLYRIKDNLELQRVFNIKEVR